MKSQNHTNKDFIILPQGYVQQISRDLAGVDSLLTDKDCLILAPGDIKQISRDLAKVLSLVSQYQSTLRRIDHLMTIYRDLYGKGSGRRAAHKTDLLRAAVVFLHASLEEFLRAIARRYLALSKQKSTYNNKADIVSLLSDIGVDVNDNLRKTLSQLQQLIKRRHNIVHRADATLNGSKQHTRALCRNDVGRWLAAVHRFTSQLTVWVIERELRNMARDKLESYEKLKHLRDKLKEETLAQQNDRQLSSDLR